MSSLDKVDDIFYLIKKYILPSIFLIAGAYLLYLALIPQKILLNNDTTLEVSQDKLFLYAALIMIVVSVVWFLYLFDLIKSMVGYAIMAVMLLGSVALLYLDYNTVMDDVKFNNAYDEREIEIKARILDIKAAEVAYKEANGTYTNSMDDLITFVKTGEKMDFTRVGALPERKISPEERDMIYGDDRAIDFNMSEEEASFLASRNGGMLMDENGDMKEFKRDTIFVPVMTAIFNSDRYLEARGKIDKDLIAFHPDSMQYVPYSQDLVVLDTASILKGEITVPTLLIQMTHPMEHPIKGFIDYTVGDVKDNHLRESWDD